MKVAWNPPNDTQDASVPRVLTVKPGHPLLCACLGGPNAAFAANVHWMYRAGKSVPCGGDDCPHCPRPKIWKLYVPVLICSTKLRFSSGEWELDKIPDRYDHNYWSRRVLEVPSSGRRLQEQMKCGLLFKIGRIGEAKNSEVMVSVLKKSIAGAEHLQFDPRPSMMRAWSA